MATTISMSNDAGYYPDHYEGSYIDVFTFVNFNFLTRFFPDQESRKGRPAYPSSALFCTLILKALKPGGSYRSIESKLKKEPGLAMTLGFEWKQVPSDSIMRQFLAGISINFLNHVMGALLQELQQHGYARGRIVSLDSTPIEARNRPPTKNDPEPKDPDAAWGYAKCKGGYYYGYKAQVLVDAEDCLPLYPVVTPANVPDMEMVGPFIEPVKEMGYTPEYFLGDKGYDSGNNHLLIREELGSVGLIAVNKRRGIKKPGQGTVNKYKGIMSQKTLDEFIPVKKRAKEYRRCCIVLLKRRPWKKINGRRAVSEGYFSRLKEALEMENVKVSGLENITKHVLLKCIATLAIALAAVKMGTPELIRCTRYFQN